MLIAQKMIVNFTWFEIEPQRRQGFAFITHDLGFNVVQIRSAGAFAVVCFSKLFLFLYFYALKK